MFSLNDILTSYTVWFVLTFASYIAIHHILFFAFKYRGPKQGERLFFSQDQQRFRINYQSVNDKSPLVIFESHIGMPLEIWSYQEKQLLGAVSSLTYDRIGYGWSSLYLHEKRDVNQIAADLIRVLLAIPVIEYNQHGKLIAKRPLILVGHSFGGIIAQILIDSCYLPVSGLILLDSPAPSLLTSSPLKDMYTIKLAAIFSFASILAEFGLLRLASIFGFSIFQPSKVVRDRLGHDQLQVLNNFHMDGKGLRMVQSELIGLRDWIKSFKEFKRNKVPLVLISGNRVDMLLTTSASQKEWSETWNNAQMEYVSERNGKIITDSECDSMSLCVSNQIKPVIKSMIQNLNSSD